MSKTYKSKRKSVTRGWKNEKPNFHEKTEMLKKCGKKCFLGPNKSFPICRKNTCKVNKKGVYSAYIRACQYKRTNISRKAQKILGKMGVKKYKI